MAEKQRNTPEGQHIHVPAQDDEDDVLEEIGGERDEETGELLVDEDKIRELGAIDAETLIENRRLSSVRNKKKTGKKGILFGTDDPLVKYDQLRNIWGPNSLYVRVKKLTGDGSVRYIRSCPRNSLELYDALMALHGQHPVADYEVKFQATDGNQIRGTGRITLPDTRPQSQQGQSYQPPNGAPPTPSPQQPASLNPVEQFGQMFEMFQRFSGAMRPQPAPPPVPVMPVMPQQPPPGADMPTQMAWMQQVFDIFQRMQGGAPQPQPQPPPTAPAPSSSIAEMTQMFELFQRMQRSLAPASPGPMHRGFRENDPNEQPGQRRWQPPQQQQPPQQVDHFRESLRVVRSALALAEEFDSILPGRHGGGSVNEAPEASDEDSPVIVKKIGDIETIRDPDGTMRWGEMALTHIPKGIKWFMEQVDKANAERQKPQQRLAEGYVEVGPNYRPPPGYVAVVQSDPATVPQQQQEEDLPPPPEHMPPPIQEARRSWDAPGTKE